MAPTVLPNIFHPFPSLPPELRIKIWKNVPVEPRIIKILRESHVFEEPKDYGYRFYHAGGTTPALLHVCREAREVALKLYQVAFGSHLTKPWGRPQHPIYVNFERDTFYIADGDGAVLRMFIDFYKQSGRDLEKIRHLAVNNYFWDRHCQYMMEQAFGFVMETLRPFTALEDFVVAVGDECGEEGPRILFREPYPDMVVIRGWSFQLPTIEGVREVVKIGLEGLDEWGLEGDESSVGRKLVRIMAVNWVDENTLPLTGQV